MEGKQMSTNLRVAVVLIKKTGIAITIFHILIPIQLIRLKIRAQSHELRRPRQTKFQGWGRGIWGEGE